MTVISFFAKLWELFSNFGCWGEVVIALPGLGLREEVNAASAQAELLETIPKDRTERRTHGAQDSKRPERVRINIIRRHTLAPNLIQIKIS